MKKLRHFQLPNYLTPLVFLLVLLAAYGPLLPLLGFYSNDWVSLWASHLQGPAGLWASFAGSQSPVNWLLFLETPVLGESPLNWHIVSLLLRWLAVTTLWWCFSELWSHARRQAAFGALLFAVYPVFTRQALAVTYAPYWLQFTVFFLSLGLMIKAQRSRQHYVTLTSLAVVTSLIQMTLTDCFTAVELVRPAVLWLLLDQSTGAARHGNPTAYRLGRTVRQALPYLLAMLVYTGAARLFLLSPSPEVAWFERLAHNPLEVLTVVSSDILAIFAASWAPVLDLRLSLKLSTFTIGALAAGAVTAAALIASLPRIRFGDPDTDGDDRTWIRQAFGLGALFTLAGILPAWAAGHRIIDPVSGDLYALPGMFGVSLMVIAVLEWLADSRLKKTILLSAMVGLLVVFHLQTGKVYRNLWAQQLDLYWQLHWRAPQIEAPTALIFEEEPVENQGLSAFSAAVNLLYHPAETAPRAGYGVFTLSPQYDEQLPDLDALQFNTMEPSLAFSAAPPDTLLIYYDRGLANCLWVVDAQDAGDPGLSDLTTRLLPVSNMERILPKPEGSTAPPADIFGPEPTGQWCYYFQKADLARQVGDWAQAAALADEAQAHGFAPQNLPTPTTHEWLAFIEGYARTGRWDAAHTLTIQAAEVPYHHYDAALCALWDTMEKSTPSSDEKNAAHQEVIRALSCLL